MEPRRVLITGGGGMLASEIEAELADHPECETVGLTHRQLDITDGAAVRQALETLQPAVLVNTAALHVEDCEADPKRAFLVNGLACRGLAQACQASGVVLVQVSSGGLFGDEVRPYHEYDAVRLKTVYARSKHAGEVYVAQHCRRHFVLRLGWLYGGPADQPKNFVFQRFKEARGRQCVRSAADKFGSPTWTRDVARLIPRLLESEAYGLYHVANDGGCSRADYVAAILSAFGLEVAVEPVDSSFFPRRADVPDCEMLTSYNLAYAGLEPLPPWPEALERYVKILGGDLDLW